MAVSLAPLSSSASSNILDALTAAFAVRTEVKTTPTAPIQDKIVEEFLSKNNFERSIKLFICSSPLNDYPNKKYFRKKKEPLLALSFMFLIINGFDDYDD